MMGYVQRYRETQRMSSRAPPREVSNNYANIVLPTRDDGAW